MAYLIHLLITIVVLGLQNQQCAAFLGKVVLPFHYCPDKCKDNTTERVSYCVYSCSFMKRGHYYDGTACWFFATVGKLFGSKGRCSNGICRISYEYLAESPMAKHCGTVDYDDKGTSGDEERDVLPTTLTISPHRVNGSGESTASLFHRRQTNEESLATGATLSPAYPHRPGRKHTSPSVVASDAKSDLGTSTGSTQVHNGAQDVNFTVFTTSVATLIINTTEPTGTTNHEKTSYANRVLENKINCAPCDDEYDEGTLSSKENLTVNISLTIRDTAVHMTANVSVNVAAPDGMIKASVVKIPKSV
ncbi:uncharacterized protein LOC135376012 [Ornithodoros turicata]|uniref:uncharacterized protein LOC135376012 n=1 Tax=Ornithodoros turicata TaxID=34597 RepID=UPI00313A0FBA